MSKVSFEKKGYRYRMYFGSVYVGSFFPESKKYMYSGPLGPDVKLNAPSKSVAETLAVNYFFENAALN